MEFHETSEIPGNSQREFRVAWISGIPGGPGLNLPGFELAPKQNETRSLAIADSIDIAPVNKLVSLKFWKVYITCTLT